MATEEGSTSLELDAEHKTVKITGKKTAEIIAILSLVVMAIMGVVLYQHSTEAKAGQDRLADTLERMVAAQLQATCLLGFAEKDRTERRQWCEDLAKTGGRR